MTPPPALTPSRRTANIDVHAPVSGVCGTSRRLVDSRQGPLPSQAPDSDYFYNVEVLSDLPTPSHRPTAMKRRSSFTRTGTQSIERCMQLLKLISSRRQHGWRLTDLAEQSGIGLSTTHRV